MGAAIVLLILALVLFLPATLIFASPILPGSLKARWLTTCLISICVPGLLANLGLEAAFACGVFDEAVRNRDPVGFCRLGFSLLGIVLPWATYFAFKDRYPGTRA